MYGVISRIYIEILIEIKKTTSNCFCFYLEDVFTFLNNKQLQLC